MSQENKEVRENLVKEVEKSGVFFIPRDSITSELHLAAFLRSPRRTVIDALFYPKDGDGIPHVAIGNRKICSMRQALEAIERMSAPQSRPRKKGGYKSQRKAKPNDEAERKPAQ